MKGTLKKIIGLKKQSFSKVCRSASLTLDFDVNHSELGILEDIFIQREYADCFPFYQKVTVVDIGAHYGYFTLFAAKNTHPESRLFAIEPGCKNFASLQKNLADNKVNATLIQKAVTASTGETKLYQAAAQNLSVYDDNALLRGSSDYETVESTTLKDLMAELPSQKIDFLKLDCEGAEYDILLNAEDQLFDHIDTISLEFHDLKSADKTGNVLVKRLRNLGYTIAKYTHEPTNYNLNFGKIIATKLY